MFEVGRLVARIALEGAQTFSRDLKQIGTEFRNLDADGKRALNDVGVALAGVGVALLAVSTLAAKAAMDWETAWAGVTKTVNGTPTDLALIESGLRDLTDVLPATHQEIAAVAEAAGQLGVSSGSVVAFTRTMIDLGETTNLTSQEAATQLARFMNVMGTSQDDVSRLGSAIVGLGNNYATTEAEIVSMAQRLSGAGRQIGLTEGEVLGLATSLSSVGIEAEAGGSAISKVMIDIAGSVAKGGSRLEQFATIAGMSAQEFAEQWRTAPGAALGSFVEGLANAEKQGGSTLSVLESLGITEVRMRDALLRSAAASDIFTDAMAQGNAEFEANNALTDEAAKRYETVASQLAMTRNSIVDLAIEFGEHLLPVISDASESVRAFTGFLGDLPDPVQSAVVFLGTGAGAIALLGAAAILVVPKIVAFRVSLAVLSTQLPLLSGRMTAFASFLTGPWGIALGAATVGVTVLVSHLDSLKSTSAEIANSLTTATTAAEVFQALGQGREVTFMRDVAADLGNMEHMLARVKVENDNVWERFTIETHGFRDALRQLGPELGTLAMNDLPAAAKAFTLITEGQNLSTEQLGTLIDEMPAFRDALIEQATALGVNVSTMNDAERAATLLELATGELGGTTEEVVPELTALETATNAAAESMESLHDGLMAVNGQNLSLRESTRRYHEALDEFDAVLKKNGNTFDVTTAAGRENQAALDAIAESALDAAQATLEAGGSEAEYFQTLTDGRQAMLDRLTDLGLTDEAAQELADTILAMPDEKEITVRVEQEKAREMLAAFVTDWSGRVISVEVSPYIPASRVRAVNAELARWTGRGLSQANGGVVEYFADGGMRENHVAQIASASTMRVWAEPETGGETYIPHAASKRGRSTEILRETAHRFGYDLTASGSGSGTATMERPSGPMQLVGTLDLGDGLTGVVRGMIVDNERDTLAGIWGEQS